MIFQDSPRSGAIRVSRPGDRRPAGLPVRVTAMYNLVGLVVSLAFAAVFFFVLYFVVRAAVRDGIREARRDGGGQRDPGSFYS